MPKDTYSFSNFSGGGVIGWKVGIGSIALIVFFSLAAVADEAIPRAQLEFFETRIRPILVENCYRCHSADSSELEGGLRLDLADGWKKGGDSGKPAIVPTQPDESPLLQAIRHVDGISAMPPEGARLADHIVADLAEWIRMGAPDPRTEPISSKPTPGSWEELYRQRLTWWSLQPIRPVAPPAVEGSHWGRNDVDRFIEVKLRENHLTPAPDADRRILIRRLHFALTGLPPDPEEVERFVADTSAGAYEKLVAELLSRPSFGEHWARHWLDIVHYADTHGYEWDVPAKQAWMYRDYVIRSFNADLPIDRFFLEQLAGDQLDPRLDAETNTNASVVATMALRLGERRHGDSAAVDGVTQEAIANVIDTVSKGFLGTTVACAQCHDHKLDAVAQSDYFAMAGMFMSTRWSPVAVDGNDINQERIEQLRNIKQKIHAELARQWLREADQIKDRLEKLPALSEEKPGFPESLETLWDRVRKKPITFEEYVAERDRRRAHNEAHSRLVVDFSKNDLPDGWRADGWGWKHGRTEEGEVIVAEQGESVVERIVPAGRWTNRWSKRLAGSLRSGMLDVSSPTTYGLMLAGGDQSSWTFIVDHSFHSERLQFIKQPLRLLTITAGNFDTLEGSIDRKDRRVYLEVATKSLNNYYPPRTGYGGVTEADLAHPQSWFGLTRIFTMDSGASREVEIDRFDPLFEADGDWGERFSRWITEAIQRWQAGKASADDATLLDEALQRAILSNTPVGNQALTELLAAYRQVEAGIVPDQTIGAMADWSEGKDERIGIRGSYTEFGNSVPRGTIRFLGGPGERSLPASSGRIEFARHVVSRENPLTARVFVNRVWQYLFGEGLVRTPDDFGHLGQLPSHPELLDHLAYRFMQEGWSLKELITYLVMSSTWRQGSNVTDAGRSIDPENRLWHHFPMRRLEAESIRDSMLWVSGRLDSTMFGPPINPHRTAEDSAKRLFAGPVDGEGRRSIYIKMTLMEPPRLLALFNQPIPKLTTGRRDVTNVPDQALALLNDPFSVAMATEWGRRVVGDGSATPADRAGRMLARALGRPARSDEVDRLVRFAERSSRERGEDPSKLMASPDVWRDVAHALFNLKEFIYVR